jgi:FAD synthase
MENGIPINPHPLTVNEGKRLATALQVDEENLNLLKSDGILNSNLLSFDAKSATIVWHTKAQFRELFFNSHLGIKSGKAHTSQWYGLQTGKTESFCTFNIEKANHQYTFTMPIF